MIFVSVGTHHVGFDRLVLFFDDICNRLDEEVIIQRGSSSYIPVNARTFQFSSNQEIMGLMKRARIIVTQAGAGSIIEALSLGKLIIVVPRLKRYGENANDHQLELACELHDQKLVVAMLELTYDNFMQALEKLKEIRPYVKGKDQLVNALRTRVLTWTMDSKQR